MEEWEWRRSVHIFPRLSNIKTHLKSGKDASLVDLMTDISHLRLSASPFSPPSSSRRSTGFPPTPPLLTPSPVFDCAFYLYSSRDLICVCGCTGVHECFLI